jgi:hypothetical protein
VFRGYGTITFRYPPWFLARQLKAEDRLVDWILEPFSSSKAKFILTALTGWWSACYVLSMILSLIDGEIVVVCLCSPNFHLHAEDATILIM